jgi:hypothetical protein
VRRLRYLKDSGVLAGVAIPPAVRSPDREPVELFFCLGSLAGMGPETDTRLRVECVVPGREPASARKEERGEFVPRGDPVREMFTKCVLSCEPGRDASSYNIPSACKCVSSWSLLH